MKAVGSNGWKIKTVRSRGLDNDGYGVDGYKCQPLDVNITRSTVKKAWWLKE